jgi:hypothetical protein
MIRNVLGVTIVFAICLFSPRAARAQANQALNVASQPPEILNIVHQQFVPGKDASYEELLAAIARNYDRARTPVYWLGGPSLSGPSGAICLNFFDTFADMEATADALGKSNAAHPEWVPMQQRLLTFVSSETNEVAVRRDGIGYRAASIDFSKARILRVASIHVRQGYEEEFAEAMRDLSAAYASLNADAPWVTYEVNAGAPSTTFVIFMPMRSLKEMDDYIARTKALHDAEGPTVDSRLREIARNAYISWDSELYFIDAASSHVSDDFAAGDPGFWRSAQH